MIALSKRRVRECPAPYTPPVVERRERIVGLNEAALYLGVGIAVGWIVGGPVGAVLAGVAAVAYSVGFMVAETRYRRNHN